MEFKPSGNPEIRKASVDAAEVIRMQDLKSDMKDLHIEHLEEQHGIDHLTGVHTRKFFEAKLAQAFESIGRQGEELRHGAKAITEASLIFIDLDNFKTVNDTLGHAQGDEVLKRAAELLRSTLREEDVLGRYGGDEFVVLLLNANEESATVIAEKLRGALDNDPELKELRVTGSLGVCSSSASGAVSSEALINNADTAMYAAKNGGQNRVAVCPNT